MPFKKGNKWNKELVVERSGNRYGHLVVVRRVEGVIPPTWLCRCDCGGTVKVTGMQLRAGRKTTCGGRFSHKPYVPKTLIPLSTLPAIIPVPVPVKNEPLTKNNTMSKEPATMSLRARKIKSEIKQRWSNMCKRCNGKSTNGYRQFANNLQIGSGESPDTPAILEYVSPNSAATARAAAASCVIFRFSNSSSLGGGISGDSLFAVNAS